MTSANDSEAESANAPTVVPVCIVGAGPTGLVLALWLTTLGVEVRIVDAVAEPGTTSRALAVQARTLELYDQLGIAREIVASGVKVQAVNMWVKGSQVAHLPFRRMGHGLTPFDFMLVFPQDAHERLLTAHLLSLGIEVERRTELVDFVQRKNEVEVRLKRPDGSEERCLARYLAGCDGAHSAVRHGIAADFPGGTYSELFYVADLDATGPAAHDEIHLDLDSADFLAVFPLQGDGRIRIVGSASSPTGVPRASVEFSEVAPRVVKNLRYSIAKVNWFSSYRVHHRVASRFRSGRAFLLGDAAHIHSPAGGQGMNTGVGDSINLAWKLAAVLNGGASESLLDTYEPERIAFARRLVSTTDRIFTFVTRQGIIARFMRMHVVPLLAPLVASLSSVRRFLFHTVSQIGIRYRTSDLSAGSAGRIHGGDRLPWVELSSGTDNFEPLTTMRWQAHIYGSASESLVRCCSELSLPLHVFEWNERMTAAGLRRDVLYVVRPDAYLALIDASADSRRLTEYFRRRGLTPASVSRSQA